MAGDTGRERGKAQGHPLGSEMEVEKAEDRMRCKLLLPCTREAAEALRKKPCKVCKKGRREKRR